jgi:hypothetical protein
MSNIDDGQCLDAGNSALAAAIVGASEDSVVESTAAMTDVFAGSFNGAAHAGEIAEFVNRTDLEDYWKIHFYAAYLDYWKTHFYAASYHVSDCGWNDYHPAYRLGFGAYFRYRGRRFDEVVFDLVRNWESIKGNSRLSWNQAKHAVRDGWEFVEDI